MRGGKEFGVHFAEEMDAEIVKLLLLPGSPQLHLARPPPPPKPYLRVS